MVECPRCHTAYAELPVFCGACGTRIPGMDPLVAPPADPLYGMVLDNRYRIIDLIGRGGMGAVYRVEHVKMGKIMAAKILHGELSQNQDLTRRFRREAETVSRLSHLNTVSVFDFGTYNGMMYLVMEYIDGQDLSDVLRRDGPLSLKRTANILTQVCSSLNEAHAKGIVHRDLKPENIIVCRQDDRDDFVKVLDFGLAKLRDIHRTKITQQGSLIGTPYYMAPEHIRSEEVDQRTDVYALGAVMYKLLTGETPFKADTPMGIISKHLTEDPTPPSEGFPTLHIPIAADGIVLRAMRKNPDERYQSADEMRRALAGVVDEATPGSEPRRLTASSRPSWHLGEVQAAQIDEWKSGTIDLCSPAEKTEPVTALETVKTGRVSSLAGAVIVGTREVAIGTRSDFYKFEKLIKKRRVGTIAIAAVMGTVAVALAVYYMLFAMRATDDATAESEPNGTPAEANLLSRGVPLKGFIAGQGPTGDVDWFRLRGPDNGRWGMGLSVTGVPGLDIALQLAGSGLPEPPAIANANGKGGPEVIPPTVISKPDVYVVIQEARLPNAPAGSFGRTPYQVVYQVYDAAGFEVEPNDISSTATPTVPDSPMSGRLGKPDDVDWFSLPADPPASTVQVSSAPGADIALTLKQGPEGRETAVDNLGPGAGEGVQIPAGPGPTYIAVHLKRTNPPVTAPAYQILVK